MTTVAPRGGSAGAWTCTASHLSPAGIHPWVTPVSADPGAVVPRDVVPSRDRSGRPGPEKLNNEFSPECRAALRTSGRSPSLPQDR